MPEVEVTECTILASGIFIYAAETYDDVEYCIAHGMHLATENEIKFGLIVEDQMKRIN